MGQEKNDLVGQGKNDLLGVLEIGAKALPSRSTQLLRGYIELLMNTTNATATTTAATDAAITATAATNTATATTAAATATAAAAATADVIVDGHSDNNGDGMALPVHSEGAGRAREHPVLRRIFTLAANLSSTPPSTPPSSNPSSSLPSTTSTGNEGQTYALWRQWKQSRLQLSEKWSATTSTANPNLSLSLPIVTKL